VGIRRRLRTHLRAHDPARTPHRPARPRPRHPANRGEHHGQTRARRARTRPPRG
jgi:hypothetical protein